MSIVHIIPEHVFLRADQGSYKDVGGRVNQFLSCNREYIQIKVSSDDPVAIFSGIGHSNPDKIFIEYSYYPKILRMLRKTWPAATIAIRAHNIEPLQNFADKGFSKISRVPRVLYGSLRLLAADVQARRHADAIYAINDWEIKNYWRFIPGNASLDWLPYYAPESVIPLSQSSTRNLVLCLPNRNVNRKSRDLVSRFCSFAAIGKQLQPELTFAITRDPRDWGVEPGKCVSVLGFQKNLKELMSGVRAIAVLSPLGFGFKTTIMDAIAAGAWAITHKRLYQRIPKAVRPCCMPIGALEPSSVSRVLKVLETPLPSRGINCLLQQQAEETLLEEFIN